MWRNFILFCLGLFTILGVFYFPWLVNRVSFYQSDITYYYEPLTRFMAASFHELRFPLWNPFFYCGMSQVAMPNPCIFYPGTWLFGALPFTPALASSMILHQFITGVGAYLLIYSFGWGAVAAAVAGMILSLGGYAFSLQSNFTLVDSAAWLPICLWALRGIGPGFDNANLLKIALTGPLLFLFITSGRPEVAIPGMLLLSGYIFISAVYGYLHKKQNVLSNLWWRLSALVIGLLLSMPMLLPGVEWTMLSPRAHGLSAAEIFRWSTNWYDLLCLILAQPFGDLNILGNKFLDLVASRHHFIPYLSSAFIGPITLTLAFWGLMDKNWKQRWLVLVALVVTLLMTLGDNTPVFPLLVKSCPSLAIFRYPVKLIIVFVWCLALLAARGIYVVLNSESASKMETRKAQLITIIFWLVALIVFVSLGAVSMFSKYIGGDIERVLFHNSMLVNEAQSLISQAGICASLIGLLTAYFGLIFWQKKITRNTFVVVVIAGLLASLMSVAFSFSHSSVDSAFFEHRSFAKDQLAKIAKDDNALEQSRILPLYFDPLYCPDWYRGQGLKSSTVNFYQYGRELLLPCINVDAGLASAWGYESAETSDYRRIFLGALKKTSVVHSLRAGAWSPQINDVANDEPMARFCRMTSTGFVLTQVSKVSKVFKTSQTSQTFQTFQTFKNNSPVEQVPILDNRFFELKLEDPKMNLRIYKVRNKLPRAYLSNNWQWAESQNVIIERIVNGNVDKNGFDPALLTWLEKNGSHDENLSSVSKTPLEQWVEFLEDNPEHIALSIKTNVPAMLVMTDHFYPGWEAHLDGAPVLIYRANAVFRAVFVSAGSHLLEFDFRPWTLSVGLLLAQIGFGIVVLLCILVGWRKFWAMALSQSQSQGR